MNTAEWASLLIALLAVLGTVAGWVITTTHRATVVDETAKRGGTAATFVAAHDTRLAVAEATLAETRLSVANLRVEYSQRIDVIKREGDAEIADLKRDLAAHRTEMRTLADKDQEILRKLDALVAQISGLAMMRDEFRGFAEAQRDTGERLGRIEGKLSSSFPAVRHPRGG